MNRAVLPVACLAGVAVLALVLVGGGFVTVGDPVPSQPATAAAANPASDERHDPFDPAAAGPAPPPPAAPAESGPPGEKVISVTGVAMTSAPPDLLVVTFGVETQEETAKEALDSNSESMNAIVSAVRSIGIPEDDLGTSHLGIHPVYEGYRDDQDIYRQKLVGYSVTNTLSVKTSQLDSAADIIDRAVGAGANRVDAVYFTLAPETQLEIRDDLLEQAVTNAKTRAEKALAPLDHRITGVKAVHLSEFGTGPPSAAYAGFALEESPVSAMRSSMKSADTPLFSSDRTVKASASVVFLIGGG